MGCPQAGPTVALKLYEGEGQPSAGHFRNLRLQSPSWLSGHLPLTAQQGWAYVGFYLPPSG